MESAEPGIGLILAVLVQAKWGDSPVCGKFRARAVRICCVCRTPIFGLEVSTMVSAATRPRWSRYARVALNTIRQIQSPLERLNLKLTP
jgi:hypothetical protein